MLEGLMIGQEPRSLALTCFSLPRAAYRAC